MMYPDYNVKNINSFKDLIEIMQSEHNSEVAFSCSAGDISYAGLVDRILKFANGISKVGYDKIRLDFNNADHYKDGGAGVLLNCNTITIAEDSEILISGINVMLGYYNDPEATAKVIIDGVLHTGDLGYIDDDGFLFITGRKSNLIVFSDGTKCSPETLEDQIVANTAVEEALVYQSDVENRATLCAKIYLTDVSKKESVINFIENALIRHKFDVINFTEEPLPKNATGKIRRDF